MEDLHAATMKEVELGHLHGPFSEREISEFGGSTTVRNWQAELVIQSPVVQKERSELSCFIHS